MANFVLIIWPTVAIVLFAALGRERGLIWSVVIGYLFLPEAITFEIPGLPDYNKNLAISLGAGLGGLFFFVKPSFDIALAPPPQRDIGAEIAEIWARLLEVETVARDKSFRELGGSDMQARVAVREMSKIGVPMQDARQVYSGVTIAKLTAIIPEDGPTTIANRWLSPALITLILGLTLAAVMTVATNGDALNNGGFIRPGLGLSDIVSMTSEPVIAMVPFVLALLFLRSGSHHVEVLKAIVFVGVFYAFLTLVEVRLSPQLNIWIYGYFQHDWLQHIRGGGFRPIVFLRHGLWLGFFLLTAALAAFALYRHLKDDPKRILFLVAGFWIFGVLLLSRNLGASMLALIFVPLVLLAPRLLQARVTMAVALIFLAYPVVWQSGLLPIDWFIEFVTGLSEERMRSFVFRLQNEAEILTRALERPLFGWGGWDRWRVFDEEGRDTTVADGIWIITLGKRGWAGYICFFGLLTLPLLCLARTTRRLNDAVVPQAMGLIMAANLIYMIPNSTLSPIGWLLIGTVAGYVRWSVIELQREDLPDAPPPRQESRYTRFAQDHSRPVP